MHKRRFCCLFLLMAAPKGACLFTFALQHQPWAWAGQNPINLASFRFCFLFLPLDLWATAKAQLCDTYFLESMVKGWLVDPAGPF